MRLTLGGQMSVKLFSIVFLFILLFSSFADDQSWSSPATLLATDEYCSYPENYSLVTSINGNSPRIENLVAYTYNNEDYLIFADRYLNYSSGYAKSGVFSLYKDSSGWSNTFYIGIDQGILINNSDAEIFIGSDPIAYSMTIDSDSQNRTHLFCQYNDNAFYHNVLKPEYIDNMTWILVDYNSLYGDVYLIDYTNYFCQCFSVSISNDDNIYMVHQVHENLEQHHRLGMHIAPAIGWDPEFEESPVWSEFNTITNLSKWGPIYPDIDVYNDNYLYMSWTDHSPTDNFFYAYSFDNNFMYKSNVKVGAGFYNLNNNVMTQYNIVPGNNNSEDLSLRMLCNATSNDVHTEVIAGNNGYYLLFNCVVYNSTTDQIYLFDSTTMSVIQIDGCNTFNPKGCLDNQGILHIAYEYKSGGCYQIIYTTYNTNSNSFGPKEVVYENSSNVAFIEDIIVDTSNNITVVYTTVESNIDRLYAETRITLNHDITNSHLCVPYNNCNTHISNIYPNPTSNTVYIDVKSPLPDQAKFILYDISGRLICSQYKQVEPGVSTIAFNINVKPGIYYYNVIINKNEFRGKLLVH